MIVSEYSVGVMVVMLEMSVASPVDISVDTSISICGVLETVISTRVPNHVSSEKFPIEVCCANSIHVILVGITAETCEDCTWGHNCAWLVNLGVIAEWAPPLSAGCGSVLSNPLEGI